MRKFDDVKDAVLGKSYDLSLAFVSPFVSQKLNRLYRGKNKPTNILSFALDKKSGELIVCLARVKKDAPLFGLSNSKFLGLLVIHGMLHLKGMRHGSKMESMERKFCRKFGF